jgi:uncharacterized membrane protein
MNFVTQSRARPLREIATTLGISERRAFSIVTDLAKAGYVVQARDGRRNRYESKR